MALAALTTNAAAAPASIASIAAKLAKDASRLGEARDELGGTRSELRKLRGEHLRLRSDVEGRLVAIYKFGGSAGAIERMAGGESMQDVGRTIEVLETVAEHDAELLDRWQELERRRVRLVSKRERLERDVRKLREVVQRSRERLSAAEARAAEARRRAAEMARIPDSPLLPKAGHPETTALAGAGGSHVDPSANQPIGFTQNGTASIYHDSFTGETTANGERYDPNAFTAAHPSLPFGTWVTVTGPKGSIQVRINDRGPFVGGRIIDLSRAAGAAIGVRLDPVTLAVAA